MQTVARMEEANAAVVALFLMINSHIIVFSIMKLQQLQVVAGLRQDLERGRLELERGRLELERAQLEQAAWRDEFRSQMEEKLQHLEEHILKSLICLPYICLPYMSARRKRSYSALRNTFSKVLWIVPWP